MEFKKKLSVSILLIFLSLAFLPLISATAIEWNNATYGTSQTIYNDHWSSQNFTVGTVGANSDFNLTGIRILTNIFNTPTCHLNISIRNNISSTDLSLNSTVSMAGMTEAGYGWVDITMPSIILNKSTTYTLVIRSAEPYSSGLCDFESQPDCCDSVNAMQWGAISSNPYSGGDMYKSVNASLNWTKDSTKDALFEIYGTVYGSTPDLIYPSFYNYWDNNGTLTDSGIGKFNVSLNNTNGSVYLNINGQSIKATNVSNMFNVSYNFANSGNYVYNWTAYGNGTDHNSNISNNREYTVNRSITNGTIIPIEWNNGTPYAHYHLDVYESVGQSFTIGTSGTNKSYIIKYINISMNKDNPNGNPDGDVWLRLVNDSNRSQIFYNSNGYNPSNFSTSFSWIQFNLSDYDLRPGQKYFFYLYSNSSYYYPVENTKDDKYPGGELSFYVDGEWRDSYIYDMRFEVYGIAWDFSPTVTLNYPIDKYITYSNNKTFSGSFADDSNLTNSTLYIWNSTGSIINNTSRSISGRVNYTNISYTLPYFDTFEWNYLVCDDNSQCSFADNNFSLNYSNPSVNRINIDVINPINSIPKGEWFDVTLNLTCSISDCNYIDLFLDPQKKSTERGIIPVIVEFKDDSLHGISKKKGVLTFFQKFFINEESIKNKHNDFVNNLEKRLDYKIKIKDNYQKLMNGISINISEKDIKLLKEMPEVKEVYEDSKVNMMLSDAVPLINADKVWQQINSSSSNITGTGIKVAIIDTGIDYTHPDLGGCFGAGCRVIGGWDYVNKDNNPTDDQGHGTHVAGIIGANGGIKGVAPNVTFLSYKVLDSTGTGQYSDIISAIENATMSGVDVISMSLGGDGYVDSPFNSVIQSAVDNGIVVVVAGGNSGSGLGTIASPGSDPNVITVGASDKNNTIASFSSRGYSYYSNGSIAGIKPDVLAPGVAINSTVPSGSCALCSSTKYRLLSGTSMATPMISGVVALIKQAHPSWNTTQIKSAITNPSKDLNYSSVIQGTGRVDALKSFNTSVIIIPNNLFLGEFKPSEDIVINRQLIINSLVSRNINYSINYSYKTNPNGINTNISNNSISLGGYNNYSVQLNIVIHPNTVSGFYLGNIRLNSTEGQEINMPFSFYVNSKVKGLISNITDDTPFYTTSSNPVRVNLLVNQSQLVTFPVKATGNSGDSYNFFAYANEFSNESINTTSMDWDITITDQLTDKIFPIFSNMLDNNGTNGSIGVFNVTINNSNLTTFLNFDGVDYQMDHPDDYARIKNYYEEDGTLHWGSIQTSITESICQGKDVLISFWFNSSYFGSNFFTSPLNTGSRFIGNLGDNYRVGMYDSKTIYFNNIIGTNNSDLNDSKWHNIIVRYNNSIGNRSIWLDGKLLNSTIKSNNTLNGSSSHYLSAYIGMDFNGYMDNIKVYYDNHCSSNDILDSSDTLKLYYDGRESNDSSVLTNYSKYPAPKYWFSFDENYLNNSIINLAPPIEIFYTTADFINEAGYSLNNNHYSQMLNGVSEGTYPYYYWSYGYGSNNNINQSNTRYYTVTSGECNPSCSGKCGGASDGCGGTCDDSCGGGADTTKPYFTLIPNALNLNYGSSLGVLFQANDNVALSSYSVNNTNFNINSTGWLKNISSLNVGTYNLNITINDTSNNQNSTIYSFSVLNPNTGTWTWSSDSLDILNITNLNSIYFLNNGVKAKVLISNLTSPKIKGIITSPSILANSYFNITLDQNKWINVTR